jgi:ATP-dependent exoDNAse (exonuclease V) alpha subunit
MVNVVAAAGLAERVQSLLWVLAGEQARLREDQLAAIQALVVDRRRVVVVKRTGWGKSAVYFLATRLLGDTGAGPTLLVSPLLSLMRDQIAKAEAIGIRAATINSTNLGQWRGIEAELAAGQVDLLLISPERLNNPQFRADVLPELAKRVGLLVIDEAHCISDWLRRESRFQRVNRTSSGPRTKGRRRTLPPRNGRVVPGQCRDLSPPWRAPRVTATCEAQGQSRRRRPAIGQSQARGRQEG